MDRENAGGKGPETGGEKPKERRQDAAADAGPNGDRRRAVRAGLIGLALLVAVIAWVATSGDEESTESAPTVSAPRIVSEEELAEIGADLGYPIYWAGPMQGKALEVTESSDGNVQVRYLDEELEAGEGTPAMLTIGSYPLEDPAGAIGVIARRPGAFARAPGNRRVVTNREKPTSVYFASPGNDVQVEVYDPSPRRAMALALSNRVEPAG